MINLDLPPDSAVLQSQIQNILAALYNGMHNLEPDPGDGFKPWPCHLPARALWRAICPRRASASSAVELGEY